MPLEVYRQRLQALVEALHAEPAAPDASVRLPGERRAATRSLRLQQGIPIDPATRAELTTLGTELGVTPPWREL
jgi:LDH2 family malate/lactate/ureidoglycolate dehydrogenase